ncbi:hypothetical protein P3342_009898 [Pyrenophora teres f. teres]|uniref:Zn(2)-C6 fungal-type domain-containing protein n=2 Tax=Pyrenophora teres f. teres TaxID=97479 RepID=E3S0Z8_PYRTT|nr:hypothetical protein PTT_15807 [Pyrenophora teres f. teres 0-1]KAE8825419.1 hypothetical protein HRS9139_08529 [Pyrenophora teres f. teres]KAE8834515.1 hypothetical protein PTNB85_05848 [Pyrenophora teres f. teres]KAE8858940.1 hypothetical protein PTNB73_08420 [Pyrenophora teres f. teres]KAE8860802.1 hypothetical protein PTNB29_05897 [Pyrenophora teres f. teres]
MEIESHPNNFLAFRSSCDRCRYMKLKCPSNGTESHESCERCSKAKLPCTYSRRSNSSRRPAGGQDNTQEPADAHDDMPGPDVRMEDPMSVTSEGSPISIGVRVPEMQAVNADPFCYTDSLDIVGTELPWVDWDVPSIESTECLWPTHASPFYEQRDALSAQCMLSLANLAVELGECLQLLRSDMRTQSIDDYPIGHIRHLSQSFVASSQNRGPCTADVSTTLLLLSCYVSLRKLYINAFANIRDHLPMGHEVQPQLPHTQDDRNMKLRGMDLLSERCMRSYTAFNITLDLLRNCDAALRLCSVCRPPGHPSSSGLGDGLEKALSGCIACALPASFKKEAESVFRAISDQEHALHEVVALLRGTLRQRMGLM